MCWCGRGPTSRDFPIRKHPHAPLPWKKSADSPARTPQSLWLPRLLAPDFHIPQDFKGGVLGESVDAHGDFAVQIMDAKGRGLSLEIGECSDNRQPLRRQIFDVTPHHNPEELLSSFDDRPTGHSVPIMRLPARRAKWVKRARVLPAAVYDCFTT